MASITTAPNHAPERDFTGINSERLAMLHASDEYQAETTQEPTYSNRGRGENAVELPFNRLAMINNLKETLGQKITNDDEFEISEGE
jgi:hypothetical protein